MKGLKTLIQPTLVNVVGVGANKKTDALSDCEMEDVREPLYHPMIVTGRAPTVDAEPLAPTRLARRRDNAQQMSVDHYNCIPL